MSEQRNNRPKTEFDDLERRVGRLESKSTSRWITLVFPIIAPIIVILFIRIFIDPFLFVDISDFQGKFENKKENGQLVYILTITNTGWRFQSGDPMDGTVVLTFECSIISECLITDIIPIHVPNSTTYQSGKSPEHVSASRVCGQKDECNIRKWGSLAPGGEFSIKFVTTDNYPPKFPSVIYGGRVMTEWICVGLDNLYDERFLYWCKEN